MRTNTQEAVLSAYIVSTGKRTPRDAAQDAAELCRLATSLNRLRVSGFVLTNPELKKARSPATAASRSGKSAGSKTYKPGSRPCWNTGPAPHMPRLPVWVLNSPLAFLLHTLQTTSLLSGKLARVDSSSLNLRPLYPEFSRGYPTEFTRFIFFHLFVIFPRQGRYL